MEHHRKDLDADDLDISRTGEDAEKGLLGDADEVDTSIEERVDDQLEQENE
jgi:hypothetical protein